MDKIETLLLTRKTVFTTNDLSVYWQIGDRRKLIENIKYYLRSSKLQPIRRGLYSLATVPFSEFELAQKLIPLSYISYYTALVKHGIIFQYYETVYASALISKNIKVGDQNFVYRQIRKDIFFNPLGLEKKENYTIASPERAFCDTLYMSPNMYFDNPGQVDIEILREVATIYKSKRLTQEIEERIQMIKHDYVR